jgi:chemotaxis protein CheD
MYRAYNSFLKSEVINIFPGELYVSNKNEIITTVLGSCISVCLYDKNNRIGGMNHFMLPINKASTSDYLTSNFNPNFYTDELRYGTISMEVLVSEIQKMGGERKNLRAKYFGGGKVLKTFSDVLDIGKKNIEFVESYIKKEGIPVDSNDVGGKVGRKLFFIIRDFKVLSKDLEISELNKISTSEKMYRDKIAKENTAGSVELF